MFRESWGEKRVSRGNRADGGDQLFGRVIFENKAARAGPERLIDILVEVECCEDKDPRRIVGREDAAGRLGPSSSGMRMSIRTTAGSKREALATASRPCAGFGDHLDVLFSVEQQA